MHNASAIRIQIETSLAQKIPSALTPQPKTVRPVAGTGIDSLDNLLRGGLPIGALSEFTGPECSGRTSVALSFVARLTEANRVCAWIDVSNALDPASAAAVGVNLKKLLWVRCGVRQKDSVQSARRFVLPEEYFAPRRITKGLHGGGFGPHPRSEVRGLSKAVGELLNQKSNEARHSRSQNHVAPPEEASESSSVIPPAPSSRRRKQYDIIEQGLRSADLVLQTGGFSAIVLDLASIEPKYVARIELSTWHRYRLAAERTQSSILLLTQHPCAKSSSELQLRFLPAEHIADESTVFTGMQPRVEAARQRHAQADSNVVPLRKPPQSAHAASWQTLTTWAVRR